MVFFSPAFDNDGDPVVLELVLNSLQTSFVDVIQEEETFRGYLRSHGETTFARWMDVYDSLVGDSPMYDPKRVSFTGQGKEHPEYKFSISLMRYSTAKDEHSLDDVFFEVQDISARAGARSRFRSNGSIYNPEIIASQNPADMRQDLERSKRFAEFKLELYDLLFPVEENISDEG